MTDYIGKVCPYCKTKLVEDDDIIVCSVCEMPHHKDCWVENKACTTFGCMGTISGVDVELLENNSSTQTTNLQFCGKCGSQNELSNSFCTVCGNQLDWRLNYE